MNRLLLIFTLLLTGCCACPTSVVSATVKDSLSVRFPTGARLGPALTGTAYPHKFSATPNPITSGAVAAANLLPVGFQQTDDCGAWEIDTLQYPFTHTQMSPRATYVWAREKISPAGWQSLAYTTAASNQYVASQLGQPLLTLWPYGGDVNAVPPASVVADAALRKFNVLLTPDITSVESAIAADHPVGFYVLATSNWYAPVKCPDGSYEIGNGGTVIGGHFPVAIAFDNTRKMMDGTTGGIEVQCAWGLQWAKNGHAWVSTAYWVNNAYLSQAFTLVGPTPPALPPLALTGNFPATLPPTAVIRIDYMSNGDKVVASDIIWKNKFTLPANGEFLTGVAAGDVWTFTASRTADNSTAIKTVTVTH